MAARSLPATPLALLTKTCLKEVPTSLVQCTSPCVRGSLLHILSFCVQGMNVIPHRALPQKKLHRMISTEAEQDQRD